MITEQIIKIIQKYLNIIFAIRIAMSLWIFGEKQC